MKPKILVVDDVSHSWHVVSSILRTHHYQPIWATDSTRAMSEARKFHPAAIVLDLGLPDRESFILLERLKQNRPLSTIPVIVVAGHDPELTEQPAREHGAVALLPKPLKADKLIGTIREALNQKV